MVVPFWCFTNMSRPFWSILMIWFALSCCQLCFSCNSIENTFFDVFKFFFSQLFHSSRNAFFAFLLLIFLLNILFVLIVIFCCMSLYRVLISFFISLHRILQKSSFL